MNDELTVQLTLSKLHADIIAAYIKQARRMKKKTVRFIFGNMTKVDFTIIL